MDATKYYGYKICVTDKGEGYDSDYVDRGLVIAYDYSDAAHKLETIYENTSEQIADISLYELPDFTDDHFSIYCFLSGAARGCELKQEIRDWFGDYFFKEEEK